MSLKWEQPMKTEYFPQVVQVIPTDDFKIYAYFTDGTIRLVDVKPLIQPGTVFEPLADLNFFKDRATVLNDTVAWDTTGTYDPWKCIDLDPQVIYALPRVEDPLNSESLVGL